jgi:glutathione-regulated potassium-efflux system ancillary protein KefF
MSRIVVIAAHPQLEDSRATRAMMSAAAGIADVDVRDLYASYPDLFIDAGAEQRALAEAQLVVWLHPMHWYGMTPLLKLWVDAVFSWGWAYGPGGTKLRGKDLWLSVSTGGPEHSYRTDSYNRYFFDAFLPPYEQTATLVGMRFVPPLVLHGAHRVDDDAIAAHARVFADRLASYPDWPELEELEACVQPEVPQSARPAEP